MSDTIPNVNTRAAQRPSYTNQAADMGIAAGITQKSTELVKEVAALLGSRGVTVTNSVTGPAAAQETGTPTGATGVPVLDNPASEQNANEFLEKLISYLQLDNQERQAQMAKDRIKTNQGDLERQHGDRTEKIKKSLAEMDKAAKARKATSIFGWIMAAVAVIAAVVTCIATAGIAVGPCIGAAIAVGAMVMSETGAMDKVTKGIAKGIQAMVEGGGKGLANLFELLGLDSAAEACRNAKVGKELAQMIAQITVAVAMIAASFGIGSISTTIRIGSQSALSSFAVAMQAGAQTLSPAIKGVAMFLGAGTLGLSTYGAFVNRDATEAQSDVTEAQKFIQMMRQRLEESEEELNNILQQLQANMGEVAQILASHTDTEKEIARHIGQMA